MHIQRQDFIHTIYAHIFAHFLLFNLFFIAKNSNFEKCINMIKDLKPA